MHVLAMSLDTQYKGVHKFSHLIMHIAPGQVIAEIRKPELQLAPIFHSEVILVLILKHYLHPEIDT
jgi:hypothetical protein